MARRSLRGRQRPNRESRRERAAWGARRPAGARRAVGTGGEQPGLAMAPDSGRPRDPPALVTDRPGDHAAAAPARDVLGADPDIAPAVEGPARHRGSMGAVSPDRSGARGPAGMRRRVQRVLGAGTASGGGARMDGALDLLYLRPFDEGSRFASGVRAAHGGGGGPPGRSGRDRSRSRRRGVIHSMLDAARRSNRARAAAFSGSNAKSPL